MRHDARFFVLLFMITAQAVASNPATATIIDLGTLGGSLSVANGINASGQVVGYSYLANGIEHAFLYSGGVMTDLGTLGGPLSAAYGINDSGQVVGGSDTLSGTHNPFSYKGGIMADLGTLGGPEGIAYAVNAAGQVGGYSSLTKGHQRGFLYSGGVMTDLGDLGGSTAAFAINDGSRLVGASYLTNLTSGTEHAFLYSGGVMADLGTLSGSSAAYGINANGQVVGGSYVMTGNYHAFLYTGGVMTDLGTLGGSDSLAYGINAGGQVVGYSFTTSGVQHAFLYSGGVLSDLNLLLPASSGWVLEAATAINDSGQIVGYGSIHGKTYGFLLSLTVSGVDLSIVPSPADWNTITTSVHPSLLLADAFGGVTLKPDAQGILDSAPSSVTGKAAYFEVCFNIIVCLTPTAQFNVAIQQLGDDAPNITSIAVAIEPPRSGPLPTDPASLSQYQEWISEAVNAVAISGRQPIIYTRRDYWANITAGQQIDVPTGAGGISNFGCLPLWDSWFDGVADLFNDGPYVGPGVAAAEGAVLLTQWKPFAGWTRRIGKQYAGELTNFDGTKVNGQVDLDTFAPGSFSMSGAASIALDESTPHNVNVAPGGLRFNHGNRQFFQTVSITNTSTKDIPGPISLALDALSGNVVVANASGITSCTLPSGSPFLTVLQGSLAPGTSVAVTLQFSDPSSKGIVYSPRVLAGLGAR